MNCPLCGAPMELRETSRFRYRNGSPRKFWGCTKWAETGCKGSVGAAPNGSPLGTPGDEATKQARIAAHAAFDTLWADGKMTRREAYRWMQDAMGMTKDEAHIAKFDRPQCELLQHLIAKRQLPSSDGTRGKPV